MNEFTGGPSRRLSPADREGGPVLDADYIEGADEAENTLLQWLKGIVKSPDTEQGFSIELYQAVKGRDKALGTFDYHFGEDLKKFVDGILDVAESYAEHFRSEVRFSAQLIMPGRPAGRGSSSRRVFVLRVPQPGLNERDPLEDPPDYTPDHMGIVAQSMAHSEAFAKEMRASARDGVETLREINNKLERKIERLEAQLDNYRTQMDEVRDMQWARDDARRAAEDDREQKRMMLGSLMTGGKLLLTHYLGNKGPIDPAQLAAAVKDEQDQAAAARDAQRSDCHDPLHESTLGLLDAFIGRLTQEKVMRLMQSGILEREDLEIMGALHKLSIERQARG
jgi:hypothetical protein